MKRERPLAYLLMIPGQLYADVFLLILSIYLDYNVVRSMDEDGDITPIVMIVCIGLILILTVLAVALAIVLTCIRRRSVIRSAGAAAGQAGGKRKKQPAAFLFLLMIPAQLILNMGLFFLAAYAELKNGLPRGMGFPLPVASLFLIPLLILLTLAVTAASVVLTIVFFRGSSRS